MIKRHKKLAAVAAVLLAAAAYGLAPRAEAQDAPSAAQDGISLELNKNEDADKGCRFYFAINNPTDAQYDSFKLELVMFRTDGIIDRRFILDLAPLRPTKKTVKLFDLSNVKCEDIGTLLVNEITECRSTTGPVEDCFAKLQVSTRQDIELTK